MRNLICSTPNIWDRQHQIRQTKSHKERLLKTESWCCCVSFCLMPAHVTRWHNTNQDWTSWTRISDVVMLKAFPTASAGSTNALMRVIGHVVTYTVVSRMSIVAIEIKCYLTQILRSLCKVHCEIFWGIADWSIFLIDHWFQSTIDISYTLCIRCTYTNFFLKHASWAKYAGILQKHFFPIVYISLGFT